MQEAVNNALKHSGGQNILVSIKGDHDWEVIVSDDGKGFDPEAIKPNSGNGLSNMIERGREAGWTVDWERLTPQGMLVKIAPATG
jgi:two-component system nitrate/nitrite sensor histidine kinase NarX